MNIYHCSEIETIIKDTWRRICLLLELLFAEWSKITLLGAPSRNLSNGSCKTSDLNLSFDLPILFAFKYITVMVNHCNVLKCK